MRLFQTKNNHALPLMILIGIVIGAALGFVFQKDIMVIKPLGDVFLNLLVTSVTPLVFFTIASSLSSVSGVKKLGKILSGMMVIFIITGIVASFVMILAVVHIMPEADITLKSTAFVIPDDLNLSKRLTSSFTTSSFYQLLDKKHMLALIVFSMLIGLATSLAGDKGAPFATLLNSGKEVMLKLISLIMYYAPIGLGAYFACLIGLYGAKLIGEYAEIVLLYYGVTVSYFLIAFSFYAFLSGGLNAVKNFWLHSIKPIMISFLTGSSSATIPANLKASEQLGVEKEIREVVIPLGATLHMDGSCLAAVLKIAVLFSLFNIDFTMMNLLAMFGVALLTGLVMSGVTDGGFVGETLIITLFGFPPEAFPIIAMIGILVDPPATTVNAVGDTLTGMMLSKWLRSS